MTSLEGLKQQVEEATAQFNELRLQKAAPEALEEARKRLADLKKAFGVANAASGSGKDAKKKERLLLKTAKVRPATFRIFH